MDEFDIDPKKLEADRMAAEAEQRSLANWGGISDNLANRKSFGEFFLGQHNRRNDTAGHFDKLSGIQSDKAKRLGETLAQYRKAKSDKEMQIARDASEDKRWENRYAIERADADRRAKESFAQQRALKGMDIAGDIQKYASQQEEKKSAKDDDIQRKKQDQVTEVESRHTTISQNLDLLNKLVDDTGGYDYTGPENQQMNQLIEDIAIDSAKLSDPSSVARPSEVDAVKKQLFEPGIFTRESSIKALLESYKQIADRKREAAYKVRGLQIPGAAQKGEDSAAIAWAKDNPTDPRAQDILKVNGIGQTQIAR